MQLRCNYRVYPRPGQQIELAKAFGCARVVFNDGLRLRQQAREAGEKYISDGELSRRLITVAKQTPQRAWLSQVSAVVLQQALADLNIAYGNFFASVSGKRKGPKMAPPRFRSRKDNRQAIRFTKNSRFKVLDNGRLRLPKIGDLEMRWSRRLPSAPSSVAIVKDAAGRYSASFVVTTTDQPLPEVDSEVGIDLGLAHFVVLSDGTKVAAPKFLRRMARKLRRWQQDLSRKQKDSANRRKAVKKVARAHARVADTRRDWQHKLSTAIIRENQAVYVEDLCVSGLGRTRLTKSVHDAGWSAGKTRTRPGTAQRSGNPPGRCVFTRSVEGISVPKDGEDVNVGHMMRAARLSLVMLAAASTLTGCMAGRELPERAAYASKAPEAEASQDASGQAAGLGTQFRTITFNRGERKLQTTVVWPEKTPAEGEGRLPIVLFGHGLGGLPPFYGELLKRWAAAGFVVAAPAFPGTSFGVDKVEIRDVPNQPADLSAVLDGLIALDASDPLRQRLDPERVAVAGHSAGAISALGTFTADGPQRRDKRIDAGVILAGNSLGVGEKFTGDPAPLLFVHANGDLVVPSSTGRSAYRAVPWPKGFLTLAGKEHITPYMAPGDKAFATVATATTDFLRWTLLKDEQAGQRLRKTPNLDDKF